MEPQWEGEKSLTAPERDHTLTDRVCTFKSWAECRDQKSVGIEPTGEIVLLTFTLIGPSEFVSPTVQIGTDSARSMSRRKGVVRRLPPSKVRREAGLESDS